MRVYEIEITPKGTVRMTHRGRASNKYAFNYMQYKNTLKAEFSKQHAGDLLTGPLQVDLIFIMPIPKNGKSQNRKVAAGDWQTTTPDTDNILKGCFDAANKVIWEDDNQVCKVSAVKLYGDVPGIRMEVTQL